jgi:hypothetical protein
MSFPSGNYYGNVIVEENADPNAVYLFSPRYKTVLVEGGMKEVVVWDATAKASAVIYNIGEGKK